MFAELIIIKKRDGYELSEEELRFMIEGFLSGEVTDYQMSALLMAIYFQGMTFEENYLLTKLMIESGSRVDFSYLDKFPIDKHSTGGVGDKVSLILAPLVASAGLAVPMMSGRGLGHSGGTLDKLEAIPGFRTNLSLTEFKKQIEKIGVAMIGQTEEIVPADRKMYALRDSTGTVPSIPLVVASILSKKVAEGSQALILDVKTGKGAFFVSASKSTELAKRLIAVAEKFDLETSALMTSMDQPLGYTVGNWVETREAIETLKGEGPQDLLEITLALGAEMLCRGKILDNLSDAYKKLEQLLDSGTAYDMFLTLVETQDGDISYIENPEKYPSSKNKVVIQSQADGYIHSLDALKIGLLTLELGAGRKKVTDTIDHKAGIILKKKIGDRVEKNEPLAEVLHSCQISPAYLKEKFYESVQIKDDPLTGQKLILKYITKDGESDWSV